MEVKWILENSLNSVMETKTIMLGDEHDRSEFSLLNIQIMEIS